MGELYSQLAYIFSFFVSLNFIMLQYYVLLILLSGKHSDCSSGVSRNTQTAQSDISAVHFLMLEGLTDYP
jgi:hypothetical protein